MAGKCSQTHCYPEDTGCNIEGGPVINCKYYNKESSATKTTIKEEHKDEEKIEDFLKIPWTGNSLGINDLNYLTASNKPILIGIAGVASAGKTTFLASLYCLLRHGKKIGNYSFSGSHTLTGWEDISWYLSWKDNSNIQFPPHTTSNSGRIPGLLHLALKNQLGERIDLIFTDAPGEWFDYWRNNVNSENSKGAKWIHDNSDAFLLFADCEMLSGSKRGVAKMQITSVADRLYENLKDRPFGLVWSKSDVSIKEITKQQIMSHLNENPAKHFKEFETSVKEGESGIFHQNICESMSWIIEKLKANNNKMSLIQSQKSNDMFLSKR